jgi:hypothetical protein
MKRTLKQIEDDLQTAMHDRTTNVLSIGALLLEAKAQVEHGEWLPWLKAQTGFSERSAQNYMAAAKFAVKNATVADLKLRPTALYYLGQHKIEDRFLKAILAEAENRWIDLHAIHEIQSRFLPEPNEGPPWDFENFSCLTAAEEETTRETLERLGGTDIEFHGDQVKCLLPAGLAPKAQKELAEDAAAAALLDGPEPELPETARATGSVKNEALDDQFKQAVETLDSLTTKRIDRWFGLLPVEQVQRVADMLHAIVERARLNKAA